MISYITNEVFNSKNENFDSISMILHSITSQFKICGCKHGFQICQFYCFNLKLTCILQCIIKWFFDSSFFTDYNPHHYQFNVCLHGMFKISLLHNIIIKIVNSDRLSNIMPWYSPSRVPSFVAYLSTVK